MESITPQQKTEMHESADLDPYQDLEASHNFDQDRFQESGELAHMMGFVRVRKILLMIWRKYLDVFSKYWDFS